MKPPWEILKLLADPTRLRLLCLLQREELAVAELQEIRDLEVAAALQPIESPVSGRIVAVEAVLGDRVEAGDALFQIERGWDVLPGAIQRLNTLITSRMPALHDMVSQAGFRSDLGDPIEVPVPPRGR